MASRAMSLAILHLDAHLVVVDKPSGMLVHRMPGCIDRDVVVQRLRDQLGRWVYPVHRLDRGTSGALVLALDPAIAASLSAQFRAQRLDKRYLALVRGWAPPSAHIDASVREPDRDGRVTAVTDLRRMSMVELPVPVGRYASARYSLVELSPRTGRTHQLRLHMAHLRHPIVGDVRHGDGRHNRLFRERYGVHRLLLCATRIAFTHPVDGRRLTVDAPVASELRDLWSRLGLAPDRAAPPPCRDDGLEEPQPPGR
jgi:tRNA pseudouridine65 synthase